MCRRIWSSKTFAAMAEHTLNPQILYATCLCTKTLFVVKCRHVQRCGRCRRASLNIKTHNRLASSLASSFENRRRQVSIFPLQLHLQTSHLLSETHLVHSFTSEPRNVQRTISFISKLKTRLLSLYHDAVDDLSCKQRCANVVAMEMLKNCKSAQTKAQYYGIRKTTSERSE